MQYTRISGKTWRRRILEGLLRVMATRVLRRYQPLIIGVTGSIGKTSAKEAIALVLKSRYTLRANTENYNNEVGIPLTILGLRSPRYSPLKWIQLFGRFLSLMLWRQTYPEVLVLEMAIDRPGDMAYLLSFIPVKIGVLTHVSGSHLEYFGTLEAIAREKGLLLTMLPKDGTAIFNADNTYARRVGRRVRAATSIGYGFAAEAQVRAENLQLPRSLDDGLMFRLNYGGTLLPMRLSQVIASHHISAVLAAVAVGVACRINLVDITQALRDFASLPGRMKLLPGLHESALIDDTYNASPASLQAALETLRALPGERRIAVLGDMLELGDETAEAHRRVAQWLQETGVEWAILVGPQMRLAGEALAQRGWSAERYVCLDHPLRAGEVLATWLRPGDRVLLKGSQGMRIELATRAVLAEPERAGELLCRQSEKWLHTAFVERP